MTRPPATARTRCPAPRKTRRRAPREASMATYRPDPTDGWIAAVRGGVVLLAPSSSTSDLVSLWPRLADDDPTPHVLDRLTAAGVAAAPPFALVGGDAHAPPPRGVGRGAPTPTRRRPCSTG